MTRCDRCGKQTGVTTGSYFNMEIICLECDELERAHPQFEEARRVECEHVKQGDYNFAGVGLPPDLKAR